MSRGTITLLNGASSSGKTSIARVLREVRERPAFYVGVDHFNAMRPGRSSGDEAAPEGLAMNRALHQAVATLAESGWDVILEHVLVNPVYLTDCVERLAAYPVLFVGVRRPLAVLERRERERGDRRAGIARDQCERTHAHRLYDLEVDTSLHDPMQCALLIQQRLADGPPPTAFQQLAHHLTEG